MRVRLWAATMGVALALAAGAAAAPPAAQEATRAPEPSEADLVGRYRAARRGADVPTRAAAVTALGEASRELSDGGASKRLTKTLAQALAEEDLTVRAAALTQLAWGRHPGTAIEALDELLQELRGGIDRRQGRPDEASRRWSNEAARLYRDACTVLVRHVDDRSVDALVRQIRTLTKVRQGSGRSSQLLVAPLATALLGLGTTEAAEAVIKQTGVYVGTGQRGCARRMHEAMAVWAEGVGWAPPELNDAWDQGWRRWYEQHGDLFVKKLGRLDAPAPAPERGRDGRRDASRPSSGPQPR